LNNNNEMPPNRAGNEMEMQQPEGLAPGTAVMAPANDEKPWKLIFNMDRWTYVWHVAVMLCSLGFVFPNATTS
jgi:hypothetical protein